MKRLMLLLLMLCLLASSSPAQTEGDFVYSVHNGEAAITAYTGSACDLVLPDTLGGYPVTAIRFCAFRNCATLRQVVIPDGVVRIGSNAFQNCTSLEQLIIPRSVTRIDTHAFYACSSLKQLSLHDNLSNVNILAFYGCSAVRYCDPDSLTAYHLTDIGYSFTDPDYPQLMLKVFEDADSRRTFTVSDCDESAAYVSFPDHITAIERYAFFACEYLTEIIIPDGVTEIAKAAFQNCRSLRQITLPGSIEVIADDAFTGCRDLTIIAPEGSAAQAFSRANGFRWQTP